MTEKGFTVRDLRMQRRQILRALAQAIGLDVSDDALPPLEAFREMVVAKRPDLSPEYDEFLAADDVALATTEQENISQHDYATVVTRRTMARNALDTAAKKRLPM